MSDSSSNARSYCKTFRGFQVLVSCTSLTHPWNLYVSSFSFKLMVKKTHAQLQGLSAIVYHELHRQRTPQDVPLLRKGRKEEMNICAISFLSARHSTMSLIAYSRNYARRKEKKFDAKFVVQRESNRSSAEPNKKREIGRKGREGEGKGMEGKTSVQKSRNF
ncbi:hypothetical protein MPTK1_1g08350 [Marchantia polymorpha subsp. ruderalis]|uniref:Uncharacterized protein n=2 Tax=Marchantia polymorpha TaxID=3197 RepID=A0AAF6AMX0_MARPO|nr:hypothetical protein MARPO_0036s0078 [Marchantia polymorpha]BBM97790.1 hypothetical protein Mp_1g08350 [Marchantia polymorpha subsp. ruderalis]|eukprot:PTQ41093.1 hypothetical protein MARPO_0036s0078 [Marchantia polymorpha]